MNDLIARILGVIIPILIGLGFRLGGVFGDREGDVLRAFVVRFTLPVLVFFVAKALNPEYVDILLHEEQCQAMLGVAIVMQIMGMLMIRKIVNIKI